MNSSGMEVPCKNSTFGCTFASSSAEDMVNHFQRDCTFHPLQCFKCSKMVPKMNFAKHYEQCCKDSSASPCPPPGKAVDAAQAKANATLSEEVLFLRECVTECTVSVKSLCIAMKGVAADVAEVKVMKEKQQDLEAIVNAKGDVILELSTSINMVVEKVKKVQEDVSGLVNKLDKDAGIIMERVENVHGLVKKCAEESKSGAESLSRDLKYVAADAAEVKMIKEKQQDVEASLKLQGDLINKLGRTALMYAEKVDNAAQGVGTIVQRIETVDGLVTEIRALTHRPADQSKVYWYVENVSQYMKEGNSSSVKSDVFVVRGYSVKLQFDVRKVNGDLFIVLDFYFCRGPNDSMLQWPFTIPYTVSLVHPEDVSKTKVQKVTAEDTWLFLGLFRMPNSEEGVRVGIGSLCTVREAQDEGFIENDAMCFSLTLHG